MTIARPATYRELDARRRDLNLSVTDLCEAAEIGRKTYDRGVRFNKTPRRLTELRLSIVLAVLEQRNGSTKGK